jgi:hypothetical protein
MKKLLLIILILMISFLPVAGKSFCECCSKENEASCEGKLCDSGKEEFAVERPESLITHFLYTF